MLKSVRDKVKLIRKWGHRYITVAFMDTFIFFLACLELLAKCSQVYPPSV